MIRLTVKGQPMLINRDKIFFVVPMPEGLSDMGGSILCLGFRVNGESIPQPVDETFNEVVEVLIRGGP